MGLSEKQLARLQQKLANVNIIDAILVKSDKLRFYTEKRWEPDYENFKGNPAEEDVPMVENEVKINHRFQTATVVKLPVVTSVEMGKYDLAVGDTVIYRVNEITEFDLVKGIDYLKPYQIIGVIKAK